MIISPWLAMIITLLLCLLWIRLINLLSDKKVISSNVSRKLIHIGTGPLFILTWVLFPEKPISKYLAALVPFLIVTQLILVGFGKINDRTSIQAMARTGQRTELLKGPLIYGFVFVLLTVLFWKSIYAIIPLMVLCGGDGLADLIGSKYTSAGLPWNKKKTVFGSLAMLFGGEILSILIILIVNYQFSVDGITLVFFFNTFLISLIATLVESISPSDLDNLTVPVSSLIMALILM